MSEDTVLAFDLPSVGRKKVRVAFDGGRLSSDGGVLLLRGAERKLGLASRLAACLRDKRAPDLIEHTLEEMLRLRMFAIAAGYEDADDCDLLRHDPMFKLAVGRLPDSGGALCSQPTMSRLENAPSKIELARLMAAMVDLFCESYRRPPASISRPDQPPKALDGEVITRPPRNSSAPYLCRGPSPRAKDSMTREETSIASTS